MQKVGDYYEKVVKDCEGYSSPLDCRALNRFMRKSNLAKPNIKFLFGI